MTEKVIHEVRFLETDDGFRIEINGDKEHLRGMGFGPGMMMGFGSMMRGKHRRRHGRHGHRRHRFGGHCGPPWARGRWDDDTEAEDIAEKSPKAE